MIIYSVVWSQCLGSLVYANWIGSFLLLHSKSHWKTNSLLQLVTSWFLESCFLLQSSRWAPSHRRACAFLANYDIHCSEHDDGDTSFRCSG